MQLQTTAEGKQRAEAGTSAAGGVAWIVLVGAIGGVAAGLNMLAGGGGEAPLARRIVLYCGVGAGGMVGLLIAVRWVTVYLSRQVAGPARQRFLRYDLWTYPLALLTLLGAFGVVFVAPLIASVLVVALALKAVCVYAALGASERRRVAGSTGYLALLFLISGFAALIYQIVWQRALFAALGVNIESITVIVSLFMFGLGLGSLLGGVVARRFADRAPLLFLVCEVGIGAFGGVSLMLIDAVSAAVLDRPPLTIALAVFGLLVVPTMLMGATLPVLVGHLYRHYRNVGKSVGVLYCLNTLGSAVACFLTADLLFAVFGQQATVLIAAGANLLVGVLVWRYARAVSHFPVHGSGPSAAPLGHTPTSRLLPLLLAGATGYISLTQEMVWMRVVSYLTSGSPSAFAHVLGVFLVGVAGGAFLGERVCEGRLAREPRGALGVVAWMLLASAIFYYVSIAVAARLLTRSEVLGHAAVYVGVAGTSLLLGGVFPLLCHYAAPGGASVGSTVSRVYVANIVGATLGPLLTGFVLMDRYTTEEIVLGLTLGTLALAGVASVLRREAARRLGGSLALPGLVAAGVALGVVAMHAGAYRHLFERLQFTMSYSADYPYKRIIQNRTGVIAVLDRYGEGADMLYGGGGYDGDFNTDPWLNSNGIDRAYFVAALHPKPASVLEVGFASGSWTRVLADYRLVEKITVVEINPAYLDVVRDYPRHRALLGDAKVSIHIDDGRRWLNRHPEARFDVIVQNTTQHWRSHVTNLVSEEYFRLCKSRLKAGGVVYLNATDAEEIPFTLARVFKHVVRFGSFVAGSDAPFALTPEQIRGNLGKFMADGRAVFRDTAEMRGVLEGLANADLTDHGPALRERRDLMPVTDDNMATEYKRLRWRDERATWRRLRAK